jgi:hypothetical protein
MHVDDMVRNMHGFFSSNSTLLKIYKNNKYGEKGGEKYKIVIVLYFILLPSKP